MALLLRVEVAGQLYLRQPHFPCSFIAIVLLVSLLVLLQMH